MRFARLGAFARIVALLAVGVLIAGLGVVLPVYWVYLLTTVAVSALVARGIGMLTGQLGIITLCQMSFAAIGGWVVSWVALAWPGVPFPLLVAFGGLAAAPVGLLLGWATARIRGVELAVVTLGFAAALDLVLRQGAFPGVGSGTSVIPAAPFDDPRWFFGFAWSVLVLLQLASYALGRTKHGLGWEAIRMSERAAAALGVRIVPAKSSAFGVAALFAGVAGGLLAGQYGLLTPGVFSPVASMVHLATAVLCGASLFGGAVLAGVFAVFVPEALRRIGLPLDVGNALLALGAFDVLRRGTGGIVEQFQARIQERAFRKARTSCDLTPPARESGVSAPGDAAVDTAAAGCPDDVPCLEVSGLTVEFGGNRALDSVALTVRSGEVHALIGPNGAGKSTLVDAVTGFLADYHGTVQVNGESIAKVPAHLRARRGVRRTFQQSRALTAVTVGDYLRLAAPNYPAVDTARGSARDARDAARRYLGLPDADLPVRLLDVGTRRILEIAAALAARPSVILLDEPAAGLGDKERFVLAARIRRIPEEMGCAVLLIEHDMEFVRAAATNVTVLEAGRVIAAGPIVETLNSPQVVAAYLGGTGGAQ